MPNLSANSALMAVEQRIARRLADLFHQLRKTEAAPAARRDVMEGEAGARGRHPLAQRVIDELAAAEAGRGAPDLRHILDRDLHQLQARPAAISELERDAG